MNDQREHPSSPYRQASKQVQTLSSNFHAGPSFCWRNPALAGATRISAAARAVDPLRVSVPAARSRPSRVSLQAERGLEYHKLVHFLAWLPTPCSTCWASSGSGYNLGSGQGCVNSAIGMLARRPPCRARRASLANQTRTPRPTQDPAVHCLLVIQTSRAASNDLENGPLDIRPPDTLCNGAQRAFDTRMSRRRGRGTY